MALVYKKIGIANQKIDFLKVKSAKVISTMRLDLE
jgi:hypothetical protein